MAELCYTQPLKKRIFTACEYYFETNPFYEIYLSVKDFKNLAEFNVLQIFIYVHKSLFAQQTSDLFEKLALFFFSTK